MQPKFEISVEGTSKTTILRADGLPIARFYAARASPLLQSLMLRLLNNEPPAPLGATENIGSIAA